jgi:hypothetical protein
MVPAPRNLGVPALQRQIKNTVVVVIIIIIIIIIVTKREL